MICFREWKNPRNSTNSVWVRAASVCSPRLSCWPLWSWVCPWRRLLSAPYWTPSKKCRKCLPLGEVGHLSSAKTTRSIWKVSRKKQKMDNDKNLYSNRMANRIKSTVKTDPRRTSGNFCTSSTRISGCCENCHSERVSFWRDFYMRLFTGKSNSGIRECDFFVVGIPGSKIWWEKHLMLVYIH